ncbi:MAG: hypothetical protein WCP55_07210 [Lentisphaerota bacterium]
MTDNALAVFENYKIRRRNWKISNYELEITNDGSDIIFSNIMESVTKCNRLKLVGGFMLMLSFDEK